MYIFFCIHCTYLNKIKKSLQFRNIISKFRDTSTIALGVVHSDTYYLLTQSSLPFSVCTVCGQLLTWENPRKMLKKERKNEQFLYLKVYFLLHVLT
jgi:hypothetical protein